MVPGDRAAEEGNQVVDVRVEGEGVASCAHIVVQLRHPRTVPQLPGEVGPVTVKDADVVLLGETLHGDA